MNIDAEVVKAIFAIVTSKRVSENEGYKRNWKWYIHLHSIAFYAIKVPINFRAE